MKIPKVQGLENFGDCEHMHVRNMLYNSTKTEAPVV